MVKTLRWRTRSPVAISTAMRLSRCRVSVVEAARAVRGAQDLQAARAAAAAAVVVAAGDHQARAPSIVRIAVFSTADGVRCGGKRATTTAVMVNVTNQESTIPHGSNVVEGDPAQAAKTAKAVSAVEAVAAKRAARRVPASRADRMNSILLPVVAVSACQTGRVVPSSVIRASRRARSAPPSHVHTAPKVCA